VLDSAPQLAPDLPDTRAYHLRRIEQLVVRGDEAKAAIERKLLAKLPPGNAFDRYLYGLEVYKKGRIAEAIPEFQAARVQAREPFWPEALLAISCVRSGRPARPGSCWMSV